MTVEVNGILVAAHELKGPLALMRQLALSLDEQNLTKTQAQMVSVSERALRQVTDLSKIARLEDGLFQLEPVAVRAVCDDVSRELSQLFASNRRVLDVSYHNKMRLVLANRDLLHSIIYNFCINALHYSDTESHSRLTVRDHKNSVRINIRDYGPALPVNVWRQIKTHQLNQPTSIAMRPGSSGLGLYIASKFSHYLHANVSAVRHRDGTSFLLDLPVSTQTMLPLDKI